MKKSLAVVGIALAAVVGLSACTSGTTSAPEATPAATPSATATPTPAAPLDREVAPATSADEDYFVSIYEDKYGPTSPALQESLIELGYTICWSLDNGGDIGEIGEIAMEHVSPEEAATIVGASIFGLCSYHESTLDEYLATNA